MRAPRKGAVLRLVATPVACALLIACGAGTRLPAGVPPVEHWTLSTGSRVAIVHFPARSPLSGPPVFFLHGGPGAYQVANLETGRRWYARLASQGRDIYVYDQVGSGLSDRLSDPRQYSVGRHVADLDAIRVRIAAEVIVLVGDSWGATLAAHYIAAHPSRVDRVAFTSPGMIRLVDSTLAQAPHVLPELLAWVRDRRSPDVYRRILRLDSLLRHDVGSAYASVRESELDELLDGFMSSVVLGRAVHDPALVQGRRMAGTGWWALLMTNWSRASGTPDPRPALRAFDRPVLVLRGESEYLARSVAGEYVDVFPRATLVAVPEAGHFIWLDRPDLYARAIESFLFGRLTGTRARSTSPLHPRATEPSLLTAFQRGVSPFR